MKGYRPGSTQGLDLKTPARRAYMLIEMLEPSGRAGWKDCYDRQSDVLTKPSPS